MTLAVTGLVAASWALASGESARAGDEAFADLSFSSGGRIFSVQADGSERQLVVGKPRPKGRRRGVFSPAWSPDGSELAFVRSVPVRRFGQKVAIFIRHADGSETSLTDLDAVEEVDPAWSPDGEWLAYARFASTPTGLSTSIVVARADGSDERTLVESRITEESTELVFVGEPAWSPDGSLVTFTRSFLSPRFFFKPWLQTVPFEGGTPQLLRKNAGSAAWSPDGGSIAFASVQDKNGITCGSDECSYNPELYVMDSDGTNAVRLTRSKASDYSPAWSPDGQRLAFASTRNFPPRESPEIYSVEPDGGCLTWLTNGAPESAEPSWRPGAGSSAPGACGAAPRPPLVEFGASGARRSKVRPALWLGRRYHGMLLSRPTGRRNAFFTYDDCGRFEFRKCQGQINLFEGSVCSRTFGDGLAGEYKLDFDKRRGALVGFGGRVIGLEVFTGDTAISLSVGGRGRSKDPRERQLAVYDHLRKISGARRGSLPAPMIPESVLRRTRLLEDALSQLGSLDAAADSVGLTKFRAANLLRLAKALRGFDEIKTSSCTGR